MRTGKPLTSDTILAIADSLDIRLASSCSSSVITETGGGEEVGGAAGMT